MDKEQRKKDYYYTPISEALEVTFKDRFGTIKRKVCPECYNHVQAAVDVAHDCKNLFFDGYDENGYMKIVGQCCCYSGSHLWRTPK